MPAPTDPRPDPLERRAVARRAPRASTLRALADVQGQTPSTLASPCVRICCLDDDDMCLGCGRMLDEIRDWGQAGDARRCDILTAARARLAR